MWFHIYYLSHPKQACKVGLEFLNKMDFLLLASVVRKLGDISVVCGGAWIYFLGGRIHWHSSSQLVAMVFPIIQEHVPSCPEISPFWGKLKSQLVGVLVSSSLLPVNFFTCS